MKYTSDAAQEVVGKRVIVSVREKLADGTETFSGFWGIIDSAHEHGIVLQIEGGEAEGFWVMPPDLAALEPAELDEYYFGECATPVTNVDYVAKFLITESLDQMP